MTTPDPLMVQLRQRRESLGLRQRDVAERIGHHPQHLGHLERGVASPVLRTVRKIATALDCELALRVGGQVWPVAPAHVCPDVSWESLTELRALSDRQAAALAQAEARISDLLTTVDVLRAENKTLRARVARCEERRRQDRDDARAAAEARREVERARAALDALARQPTLTHDLIDRARTAVAATIPEQSEAA